MEGLCDLLQGPTAFAISNEDAVAPARLLKQYNEKFKLPVLKGGANAGVVLSVDKIKELANIPDMTTLRTKLAYSLVSPITKLAMTLKAVSEKQGEAAPETASAPEA